jgi:hypothetical protein
MKKSDSRQIELFPVLGKLRAGPSLAVLERKLDGARHELHNIQVIAMKPGRTAEQLEMLHKLEYSSRAKNQAPVAGDQRKLDGRHR